MALSHYLSSDRLRALALGRDLPTHARGSALFADICGFTALMEGLSLRHGERDGVEALTQPVGGVYDALITEVQRHGGHTLAFAGDALTCWFDQADDDAAAAPAPQRAVQAALAMQAAMQHVGGPAQALALKVSVASGPARRFTVGDARIQTLDVLAGPPVTQVALAEALARPGDVMLDVATAQAVGAPVLEWREHAGGRHAVVDSAWPGPLPPAFDAGLASPPPLPADTLRPWVHPFVYERERAGEGLFATDLRPVVALFLRFGGLPEELDDAAVQQLDAWIASAQRVLQHHGGVLLELIMGDKGSYFYAAFGAARAHEDDARRAMRAAMELRTLFAAGAGACLGLASGMLRVGGYGGRTRQSFGAQGDATNAAARLMMLAKPGEILASGRVRGAVANEFALQARVPIVLKGKAEPMPVFALLGPLRQRAMRLQESDFLLPMVGRDEPLAQLAQTLEAAAHGAGSLVLVQAEAGMGKTRLLAEGTRLALRRGFVAYGGATSGDGVRAPYQPWHGVWTALLELDTTASPRAQARAVEAALARLAPEHAEAWPLLGAVLGLALPDNAFTLALAPKDRKALLEALLVKALRSAASEAALDGGGVLLVLEDLHVAEALSLDLLTAVVRAADTLPLLVWVSQRPVEVGGVDLAGDTRETGRTAAMFDVAQFLSSPAQMVPLRRIVLGGLDATQVDQMVRAKLAAQFPERAGSVPALLVERLVERADGNPFYVEELLNHLHDRGLDPHLGGAWVDLDWPVSLRSLVLSRIDRLHPPLPMVLKAASVPGMHFTLSVVQACQLGLPVPAGSGERPSLLGHLQALASVGLTSQLPGDGEPSFCFQHRVTQEVAYDSIARPDRVQLHQRVAEHLESAAADTTVGRAQVLAHHWARAGRPDKAWPYLLQAGDEAAAGYDNEMALSAFTQVLAWLPGSALSERVATLLRREAIFDLLGRHQARRGDLAELTVLAGALEPAAASALRWQLALRQARLALDSGDFAAASAGSQAALDNTPTPVTVASVPDTIEALLLQARALLAAGQAEQAREPLQQVLTLARRHGLPRSESHALAQLGLVEWQLGQYDAAQAVLLSALPGLQQAGDLRQELDVHNYLGVVAKARARFDQAVARYEQALAIARRIGDRSGQAILLNNMGSACLACGDFQRAAQFTEQAADIWAELQERSQHGVALVNRAEAHRELGQFAAAQALGERALALLRASGARRAEAAVQENLGRVCMALGDAAGARERLQAALDLAREIGLRAIEASSCMDLGRVFTAAAEFEPADVALQTAASLMAELGDPLGALEVQAARAEWALANTTLPEPQRARAAQAEMAPLLEQLQATQPTAAAPLSALPMSVYRVAWRVLSALGDSSATALLARARAELRDRAARITDPAARRDFLNLADHRALLSD